MSEFSEALSMPLEVLSPSKMAAKYRASLIKASDGSVRFSAAEPRRMVQLGDVITHPGSPGENWTVVSLFSQTYAKISMGVRDATVVLGKRGTLDSGWVFLNKGCECTKTVQLLDCPVHKEQYEREVEEYKTSTTFRTRQLHRVFIALANAMAAPQGRKVILVQAVEEAVKKCPGGLNATAYRAALVSAVEYNEIHESDNSPMVIVDSVTKLCLWGGSEIYNNAIKRAPQVDGPWTGRRGARR